MIKKIFSEIIYDKTDYSKVPVTPRVLLVFTLKGFLKVFFFALILCQCQCSTVLLERVVTEAEVVVSLFNTTN